YTDRFPKPGESVPGSDFVSSRGGKGANQAIATARLGGAVSVIGRVGNDIFGDDNIEGLRENGINVDGVDKSNTRSTGTALITVDSKGENTTVVSLGANVEMDEKMAEVHAHALDGADVCIAQATICQTGNKKFFEIARSKGILTICNPAPADKCEDRSLLSLVDILCVNRHEVLLLFKILPSRQL
ncbi:hypothetical protein OESDEN_13869, partial [Oesophagostomum dentatum]